MTTLTPEEREQARLSILRYGARPVGFGIIVQYLRSEGFRTMSRDEVTAELQYLQDKGFMVSEPKPLSPEVKVWRATAAGRDYLAEQGMDR